jgi:hypothetical protein
VAEDAPIVLANLLTVHLEKTAAGFSMTSVEIHNEVRPTHVATSTIQELNCCASPGVAPPPAPVPVPAPPAPPPDTGPRADPESVKRVTRRITFKTDKPLAAASVSAEAFSVTQFDEADGWSELVLRAVSFKDLVVTIDLKEAPEAKLVRLLARGSGETPLLGVDFVPFAGAAGGPPGTSNDGNDFVFILRS